MLLLDNITIHNARYQEMADHVASGSVAAVITDPPYGVTAAKWDSGFDAAEFWRVCNRVCAKRAPRVVFGVEPFSTMVRASNIKQFRYDWVWVKTEPSGHLNAKKMPMRRHEIVSVFGDGAVNYWPEKTSGHARKSAKTVRLGSLYGKADAATSYDSTERYPTSVLQYSRNKQTAKVHPTQKPLDLLRYLVRTYTRPGDLVMDPFCGSGSTALACAIEGRRFVGAEVNAEFHGRSVEWITKYKIVY